MLARSRRGGPELRTSALFHAAPVAAADAVIAARPVAPRLLATFFPTPFVGFPFVLKGAPPVPDHRIRRILSAIAAVIADHARRCFNFRAVNGLQAPDRTPCDLRRSLQPTNWPNCHKASARASTRPPGTSRRAIWPAARANASSEGLLAWMLAWSIAQAHDGCAAGSPTEDCRRGRCARFAVVDDAGGFEIDPRLSRRLGELIEIVDDLDAADRWCRSAARVAAALASTDCAAP